MSRSARTVKYSYSTHTVREVEVLDARGDYSACKMITNVQLVSGEADVAIIDECVKTGTGFTVLFNYKNAK